MAAFQCVAARTHDAVMLRSANQISLIAAS